MRHGGVTVHENGANGYLSGYAWCENTGWIHFQNAAPAYKVRTTAFDAGASGDDGTVFRFR